LKVLESLHAEPPMLRLGKIVGRDERYVAAEEKSGPLQPIRPRSAGEHDNRRPQAVLGLKAFPERAELLDADEAQLNQGPAVLIFLVIDAVDIHVVAAAGVAGKRRVT